MKLEILYPGSNSMVRFDLEQGESIKAESDAMIAMSPTISLEGKMEGGFLAALGRSMLAGEKFFFQKLVARTGKGYALLGPTTPGDVYILDLDGSVEYNIHKDGFLAAEESVNINTQMQNLAQGLLSGEGFFILKAKGRGKVILSSFGAIHELNLGVGEDFTIDNGHLVAWSNTTQYSIDKATHGWISSFTSGEGLVCRFRGPGKVLIQSRNADNFGSWLRSLIIK
ncbi:MAG: TIGR00266 family protein [Candidatus Sericytochromatia bacterium]